MQAGLQRVLRVRPGEGRLVLVLGLILAASMLAGQVAGIVSVSGFLDTGSVNGILVVWVVDMLVMLVATGFYSVFVDRFDRKRLLAWLLALFALFYVLLEIAFAVGAPSRLIYGATVIFADLQWGIFPLVFWVLANDLMQMAQAQRLFPVIGAGGFVGRLAGIGVALLAPELLRTTGMQTRAILILNTGIYVVALLCLWIGLRGMTIRAPLPRMTTQRRESFRQMLGEGWSFVREVPVFRYLGLVGFAGAIALTVLEFRFLTTSRAAFPGLDAYQRFYSLFRLSVASGAFLMQAFVTSRLIQRVELKRAVLFLPAALLTSLVILVFFPAAGVAIAAMILTKLCQQTIDDSANSAMQNLVPEERRGRVALVLRSYLPASATILAAGLIGAIVAVAMTLQAALWAPDVYLFAGVLAAAVAVWAALRVRATYDTSLLNWRLKRRQRGGPVSSKLEF
jgi:ATP/ADP translocase